MHIHVCTSTQMHTHAHTSHSQSPVLPYDKGSPFWLYSCASEDFPSHNSEKEGENWGHQNLIIIATGSLSMMGTHTLGIQYSHNDSFRVQSGTDSFLKSLWVRHHWLLIISLWDKDWFISIMERGDRKTSCDFFLWRSTANTMAKPGSELSVSKHLSYDSFPYTHTSLSRYQLT